jgi:hypothetical protein
MVFASTTGKDGDMINLTLETESLLTKSNQCTSILAKTHQTPFKLIITLHQDVALNSLAWNLFSESVHWYKLFPHLLQA